MASNYEMINWQFRDADGVLTSLPAGVDVHVYDVTAEVDVAESPLTTDSNGETPAGTFAAVAVGTRVRFRIENYEGLATSRTQVTT
jgi:hypothetical protein